VFDRSLPPEWLVAAGSRSGMRRAARPRAMALLVAAVIVHDKAKNRVVLLKRSEQATFAQGRWDLPVGKSEPGEPITETAVRELREETGLIVKPGALRVAHIIHGAGGVRRPTNSSLLSSPPTNGPVIRKTASHGSTPKSAGSTPTPSPRSSWTRPPAPSAAIWPVAHRFPSAGGADDLPSRRNHSRRRSVARC
jgi:8-oxo-dGTP pyrophosphatase MutT (NUDIX family)